MFEWDAVAKYYDLFLNGTEDIPFWQKLSKDFGSPVLDTSCGTGRLTFPIAESGIDVVGMDLSQGMLRIAKQKLRKYPKAVQKHVTLVHGDIVSFEIKKKFKAIYSPLSFWPVTVDEQTNLLTSIKRHLLPQGYFVIDVYNYREREENWEYHRLKTYKHFPSLGFTLIRQMYTRGNAQTKIEYIVHFLDRIYKNGTVKRITTERTERHYTKEDLITLLEKHGFKITQIYGGYNFEKWSEESKRLIILAIPGSYTIRERIIRKLGAMFS